GWTEIGADNRIFQFSSIGADPQDLKYAGQKTYLKIGDRNRIREFTTLNRGTAEGGGLTTVGNDNLFMAYSHVAHDCIVHDHAVLANGATLAGHVEVGSASILGGLVAVHQFCRIGCHTMISGGSMVNQDIPPYTIAQGDRAKTVGLNLIGLKRCGFSERTIRGIKKAYRLVFRSGLNLEGALLKIAEDIERSPELDQFVNFIKDSQRGIAK
ncbi:MAG: acyl-ACP--UDP-N-acetylglucosamine O-acyltransferase, partial [Desulfuromonadales bacterium]|nr:acyl-ACP--UDP-N-acetylglucosamine O-acyltransferase [Desulfuromonadales bacterium]